MEVWHIWIIIALLFFILEIFTPGFAVACLSIGAIGGAIATLAGWEFKFQLLVFAITSIVALVSVRPLVIKFLKSKKKLTATIGKPFALMPPAWTVAPLFASPRWTA